MRPKFQQSGNSARPPHGPRALSLLLPTDHEFDLYAFPLCLVLRVVVCRRAFPGQDQRRELTSLTSATGSTCTGDGGWDIRHDAVEGRRVVRQRRCALVGRVHVDVALEGTVVVDPQTLLQRVRLLPAGSGASQDHDGVGWRARQGGHTRVRHGMESARARAWGGWIGSEFVDVARLRDGGHWEWEQWSRGRQQGNTREGEENTRTRGGRVA